MFLTLRSSVLLAWVLGVAFGLMTVTCRLASLWPCSPSLCWFVLYGQLQHSCFDVFFRPLLLVLPAWSFFSPFLLWSRFLSKKGAQLSTLKVRVRSLPPRDALTVIVLHCCLLRYLSVPSLLGTYFSAVLASFREKTSALSFTLIRLALATTLSVIFLWLESRCFSFYT